MRGGELVERLHDATSCSSCLPSTASRRAARAGGRRRAARWPSPSAPGSPRSTTGRSSCRRRRGCRGRGPCSRRRAPTSPGRSPKRTVPHWCATPASGIRWSRTDQRGISVSWQPSGPEQALELAPAAACGARCCGRSWRGGCGPWRSTVTRLSGCGQVLGGQPEVDRVLGHVVEREPRREPRRAGAQDVAVGLAEHLDVPEREVGVVGAPVVVVDAERLLELRRVRRLRDRDHARVDVGHVVAADDVGGVRQPVAGAGRAPSAAAARPS